MFGLQHTKLTRPNYRDIILPVHKQFTQKTYMLLLFPYNTKGQCKRKKKKSLNMNIWCDKRLELTDLNASYHIDMDS